MSGNFGAYNDPGNQGKDNIPKTQLGSDSTQETLKKVQAQLNQYITKELPNSSSPCAPQQSPGHIQAREILNQGIQFAGKGVQKLSEDCGQLFQQLNKLRVISFQTTSQHSSVQIPSIGFSRHIAPLTQSKHPADPHREISASQSAQNELTETPENNTLPLLRDAPSEQRAGEGMWEMLPSITGEWKIVDALYASVGPHVLYSPDTFQHVSTRTQLPLPTSATLASKGTPSGLAKSKDGEDTTARKALVGSKDEPQQRKAVDEQSQPTVVSNSSEGNENGSVKSTDEEDTRERKDVQSQAIDVSSPSEDTPNALAASKENIDGTRDKTSKEAGPPTEDTQKASSREDEETHKPHHQPGKEDARGVMGEDDASRGTELKEDQGQAPEVPDNTVSTTDKAQADGGEGESHASSKPAAEHIPHAQDPQGDQAARGNVVISEEEYQNLKSMQRDVEDLKNKVKVLEERPSAADVDETPKGAHGNSGLVWIVPEIIYNDLRLRKPLRQLAQRVHEQVEIRALPSTNITFSHTGNVVLPLVAASRVGSDLQASMQKAKLRVPCLILIFHHLAPHNCRIRTATKDRLSDRHLVESCQDMLDLVFWNGSMYDCDANTRAVATLKDMWNLDSRD